MHPPFQKILVIVASVLAASLVIGLVQQLNYLLYPPPEGIDWTSPEEVKRYIEALPVGAYAVVELSYVLGSIIGGIILGRYGGPTAGQSALFLGLILTGFNVINIVSIPTPTWFAMVTTMTFLPGVILGTRLGRAAAPNAV